MAQTEAQKRAQSRYEKQNVKRASIAFYPSEMELWERLQAHENKAGYIKDLIRKDLEQSK